MSKVVRLISNPNAPAQQYALWDTGRVDELGGALPITDGPSWYIYITQPAVDIHVTDWNAPAGYILEHGGGFHSFGGAPDVGIGSIPEEMPGVPLVNFQTTRKYIAMQWNPDGSGQGYALDVYGQYYHFGGATPCPRVGALTAVPIVRGFDMQWDPFKRAVMFTYEGGRSQDFPYLSLPLDGYFDAGRDWARDLIVTDFGNFTGLNPSGYLMTADGRVYEWGPNKPQDAFGGPFRGASGTQVGLALVNPTSPLTIGTVSSLGQYEVYTASTPPTVVPGGSGGFPPAVVTDTTRPKLAWSFTDPELDKQAAWQLVVWPQTWVDTHDMTFPYKLRTQATFSLEGTDRNTRGVDSPVDLDNGAYRFYIRVQDTSGRWSAWANKGWTQNVPVPATPTNLTATATGFRANLVLTLGVVEANQLVNLEYTDDGVTWLDVRGAEALPATTVVYGTDYDVPFGAPRTYRGRVYFVMPRTRSLPSEEQTVTVELYTFALTSTADPALGGEVFPMGTMGWSRENVAGVFETLGSEFPVVITDGTTRSERRTLTLDSSSLAGWRMISALATSGHTLLLREPFGETSYCRVVGSWSRSQIRALADPDSPNALAHVHSVDLPLVQVARPLPAVAADPEI